MIDLSVLIPAHNEKATILELLGHVARQNIDGVRMEVVVIDDGSEDGTVALLEKNPTLYTTLIKRLHRGGKGAAILDGLRATTGDYILFQDADLEYDPDDYEKLLRPVLDFDAGIVMGSRLVASPCTRVSYFWHKFGNRLITFIFNILNNTTFTDIYSCYLLFRRELVDPATLKTTGWEQQAEILSKAVAKAPRMYEVPIRYYGRTYAEGKKIKAYHALAVIRAIVVGRLFR